MKLSEKIYYFRKKIGKSQETLAERLGVSRQAVSKWETGESEPDLANLCALATAFGVTVDFLLSDEEPAEDCATSEETIAKTEETCGRTWVDALPGAIGRLVSRYGWLGGVYLAVVGGITVLMGIAILLITGSIASTFNSQMGSLGGMSPAMPSGMADTVPGEMYIPMYVMAGLFIIIGLATTITGIIIAIKLKKTK